MLGLEQRQLSESGGRAEWFITVFTTAGQKIMLLISYKSEHHNWIGRILPADGPAVLKWYWSVCVGSWLDTQRSVLLYVKLACHLGGLWVWKRACREILWQHVECQGSKSWDKINASHRSSLIKVKCASFLFLVIKYFLLSKQFIVLATDDKHILYLVFSNVILVLLYNLLQFLISLI